jgi:NAD-dependent deacetylase
VSTSEHLNISDSVRERLRTAERVVVFSGAGISKESGLDTFRGTGGLWEKMRPEELATPQAFRREPAKVWRWYGLRYDTATGAQPNPGHLALAEWEDLFPSMVVVTQNVDGLHRRAGSRDILEVHGTILDARCNRCGRVSDMGEALAESREEPPVCSCGGKLRPNVVWFGENLDPDVLDHAAEVASSCDLFLSVGTSAIVYPAAGLIEVAHRAGACFIEVNPEPTPFSGMADLRIEAPAGEALPKLTEEIRRCRKSL